ncbi:hypothetical protein HY468_03800 [Candidatus Roizmanbacteria bacterium]|nr:hypothetical protein [Candidatus Roizmanbacteria bacterium]
MKKARLVIGIQGGRGSFNEEAVRYYLAKSAITNAAIKYLFTTERVLSELEKGTIDRGQFAIHNSTGGIVWESIQAMGKHRFTVLHEFAIKIAHAVMIRPDVRFEEIDTIMTHPQVLAQCRMNLAHKYPNLKLTSGEGDLIDHAVVAEYLSKKKLSKNIAVMGSKVLADIYDLKIVEDNLQDLAENYTSFLWVKK